MAQAKRAEDWTDEELAQLAVRLAPDFDAKITPAREVFAAVRAERRAKRAR